MTNCELYSNSDNHAHKGEEKRKRWIEQQTELRLVLCILVLVGNDVSRVPRLPDHVWSPNRGGDIGGGAIGDGLRAGPVGDSSGWGGLLAGGSRSWACRGILLASRVRPFLLVVGIHLIIATLLVRPGPLAQLRWRRGFRQRNSRPGGHCGRGAAYRGASPRRLGVPRTVVPLPFGRRHSTDRDCTLLFCFRWRGDHDHWHWSIRSPDRCTRGLRLAPWWLIDRSRRSWSSRWWAYLGRLISV